MARIQQFEAPDNLTLHPSEAGSAAFREAGGVARQFANQSGQQLREGAAAMGQGIKAIGSGIGDLYDAATAHDDSLASVEASRKSADFDFAQHEKLDHLMDPEKDPNDPTGQAVVQKDPNKAKEYIGKYLNDWNDQRSQLRSTITNEKALKKFDSETESGYRAISNKAYSVYGEVNLNAVTDNITKSVNSRAGIVFSDPTQIDAMLAQTHTDLADFAGKVAGISADARSKMGTELETKSARVIIERGIDGLSRTEAGRAQALEIINSGKYDKYIGEDKGKLIDHVRTMSHADTSDQERARRVADQQQADANDKHLDDIVQANAQGTYKLTDVYTDPKFAGPKAPEYRDRAAGILRRQAELQDKGEGVDKYQSAQNVIKGIERITAEDGTEGKITSRKDIDDMFVRKEITQQDYTYLLGKFDGVKKGVADKFDKTAGDFINKWRDVIDPYRDKYGNHSALGNLKETEMRRDLDVARKDMVNQGKDPNSLLDSNSPDYFFQPGKMKKYYTSSDEAHKFESGIAKDFDETIKKYHDQVPGAKPDRFLQGQPNAHSDKNLFSSGRAQQLGINMESGDKSNIVKVDFAGGKSVEVNKWAAPHFQGFLNDLAAQGYNMKSVMGFVDRHKNEIGVKGAGMSEHAFGNAIDINPFELGNGQGLGASTNLPSNIRELAAKHGLIWGGDWNGSSRDTMHFEWAGKKGAASEEVAVKEPSSPGVFERIFGTSKTPGEAPSAAAAPVVKQAPARVSSINEVSNLRPGSRFIIPEGPYKGMIGTVPEPHVAMSR
jgi:hypothetical protein